MSPIYNKPVAKSSKILKNSKIRESKAYLRIQNLLNQAVDLHQKNALNEALILYENILATDPKNFEALHLSGLIAYQSQNAQRGVQLMREALKINPISVACLVNLGLAEHTVGELILAKERYLKALAIRKDLPQAHYNLGNIYKDQKKWSEAKLSYEKAIALKPDYWEALLNIAHVLESNQEWPIALKYLNRVIKINPFFSKAYNNRANIYKKLERWTEASLDYETSIHLDHLNPDVYVNKGNLLKELGHWDNASACYRRCIELNPIHPKGLWNQSLLRLMLGQFEQGWVDYEARWSKENVEALNLGMNNSFEIDLQKQWRGNEDVNGKRLLLYAEQGIGDSIQFVRFVPHLINMGAVVILMVQKPLVKLFNQIKGLDLILELGEQAPTYDFACPLMSLPLALRINREEDFQKAPYLKANSLQTEKWKNRLGHIQGLRVGVAWRGSSFHANDKFRSIDYELFKRCIPMGARCLSLQKEVSNWEQQMVQSDRRVEDYTRELNDLSDTAGLCENLDLVICVDTSVAHLASALGKEVWILVPFSTDWRWMINRDDSPWYEKVTLYRQHSIGDWSGVLNKIKSEWDQRLKTK